MNQSNIVVGSVGERLAAEYLAKKGFTILARNYRRPYGEIDIVARRGDTTHFVEVKTVSREMEDGISRETDDYRPEERVTPGKLKRLTRAISSYIAEHPIVEDYQIDVVAILLDQMKRTAKVSFYENVTYI
jgi:putative endonuclease